MTFQKIFDIIDIENKVERGSKMLKLVKTIIDSNRSLAGFVIKGKESEFGGFSNEVIERGIPIDQLINRKFSNNQIKVVKGKIYEIGKFKINSLPMLLYMQNNYGEPNYMDIDNNISLVGRFVQDNKNIGFRVRFADGAEDNFKYENVLMLCRWFKPDNFAIRTSSKGLQYISGKNGIPLESIPATVIGEKSTAKRMKSAAKEKTENINSTLESGFDILDIYNFINSCGGCVIKLPGVEYVAASEKGAATTEGFNSYEIGEVAKAIPKFNSTKLNVNAAFKKVGYVEVDISGTKQKITTYVNRMKSIFLNGENYMKVFGIAVPTEKEAELVKTLGASLALEKITDNTVTAPLGQVIDAKSLAFYKVDTSKVDLISVEKRKNSLMSNRKLAELCKKQYEVKLVEKAVGPMGGIMKNLKAVLDADDMAEATDTRIAGAYAMYSEEALNALQLAGIDIYSGAYNGAPTSYKKPASGGDGKTPVEIEYVLDGYDVSKLTGSKILDAVRSNNTDLLPISVIETIKSVTSIKDPKEQYKKAKEVYDKYSRMSEDINKKFWMHNASMFLNGNKNRIHTQNSSKWTPDTSSRAKKSTVYMATDCEGLKIKFNGVTI